jgi:hypothetical protein
LLASFAAKGCGLVHIVFKGLAPSGAGCRALVGAIIVVLPESPERLLASIFGLMKAAQREGGG